MTIYRTDDERQELYDKFREDHAGEMVTVTNTCELIKLCLQDEESLKLIRDGLRELMAGENHDINDLADYWSIFLLLAAGIAIYFYVKKEDKCPVKEHVTYCSSLKKALEGERIRFKNIKLKRKKRMLEESALLNKITEPNDSKVDETAQHDPLLNGLQAEMQARIDRIPMVVNQFNEAAHASVERRRKEALARSRQLRSLLSEAVDDLKDKRQ